MALGESFYIASAVWNVGQSTPIHGHGVWGVVGIYSGAERELRFGFPDPEAPGPVELLDEEVFTPGQVTVCCTTDQDIHKVSAATDEPCIGIHIYGGNIGRDQAQEGRARHRRGRLLHLVLVRALRRLTHPSPLFVSRESKCWLGSTSMYGPLCSRTIGSSCGECSIR